MNSNYAAARLIDSGGPPPAGRAAEAFAALLAREARAERTLAEPLRRLTLPAGEAAPPPPAAPALTEEPPAPPEQPPTPSTGPRSTAPRFADVPASVRYPLGPYRQAPAEHGGEWWLTNPFTGAEPWLTQGLLDPSAAGPASDGQEAPPEFVAVFGPRPSQETHRDPSLRAAAVADWERNRSFFKGVGLPPGFTPEQAEAAARVFEHWGLGRPVFYEGRYGWMARFPNAAMPGFEAAPFTVLEAPHLVVARYQVERAAEGADPAERHPFVPPFVFGAEA